MNFIKTIRRSLKTEHHDFTQIAIPEAVVLLAIPMILELSLEGIFAVTDMFFVSRLGQNAIAAVGLTESVVTIVYSIAIGLSTGATAIVARRIGEKNPEAAAHASAQAMVLSLIISLVLAAAGIIWAPDILQAMGAAPDVVRDGAVFTRILLGGSTAIVFLFLINGIFRGAGDAAMAMRSLWIASGINIVLNPLFIYWFGLKGAAITTVLGRSCGVLYQSYYLIKGEGELKLRLEHFKHEWEIIKSIIKIAMPASLQFIIGSGSWIVMNRLVAETGGTAASAGYQIATRTFVFFILPAWGLSNAAATLVGQNLGAKLASRAEESVYTTAKYSAYMMALVTFVYVFFAPDVIRIFSSEDSVVTYALYGMRLIGAGYIFYGIGMVLTQALNGAGDTKTPTWINVVCFWIFQTPFAYFLTKETSLGARGTMLAIPVAHALLATTAWIIFRRGRWKIVKV